MNRKKLGKKLLFPPVWVQLVLTAISACGLTWVFLGGHQESLTAVPVYVISFYTLSVVCLFCVLVLPGQYDRIKQRILAVPLVYRYVTDKVFGTKVGLLRSLTVNLLYVGVNVASFFQYRSWWFLCLAVYYTILAVMRYLLVRYIRLKEIGTDRIGELKRARLCSYILLLLNFFLSGAVLMILYQDKGYAYGSIMIYVIAVYTFYITTNAIINLFRYKKFGSPVMSAAKTISAAAALVSMLNLETAMFDQFGGEMSPEEQRLMIMLTGAGVAVAVISMSVYMIVRCTKEIRKIRRGEDGKSE